MKTIVAFAKKELTRKAASAIHVRRIAYPVKIQESAIPAMKGITSREISVQVVMGVV